MKEIVKELLRHGILVSPEIISKLKKENLDDFIRRYKGKDTLVVCEEKGDEEIKISVKNFPVKKEIKTEDFIERYNKRFDFLKNILMEKTNAVSINKTRTSFNEVEVIGMVREKTNTGFVIEDPTDTIEVIMKTEEPIEPGDVLSVLGLARENKFFGKKITWPDINLINSIKRIENTNLFLISEKKESIINDIKTTDVVVETKEGMINKRVCALTSNTPNPAWITISKGNDEITLLVYKPERYINPILYLKKRHLSPTLKEMIYEDDPHLIKIIPDIFWIISDKNSYQNYKGVTIIESNCAKVNLNTRDVVFY